MIDSIVISNKYLKYYDITNFKLFFPLIIITAMSKSTAIDYVAYSKAMRAGLSGEEICMQDSTLNHQYFHSKKGFYWSLDNEIRLGQGLRKFGLNAGMISKQIFNNEKTEI